MSLKPISSKTFSLIDWNQASSSSSQSTPVPLPNFPDLQELTDGKKKPQHEMALEVLANFLAGGLATGGEKPLDGMYPQHNFQVWEWVLNFMLQAQLPIEAVKIKKILFHIRQLLDQSLKAKELFNHFSENDFLKMVKDHTDKVKALEIGKSHLIYGGWGNVAGGTGHALIYKLTRTSKNNFEFRLYTATNFQLSSNLLSGSKLLLCPIVRWENIPEEYLFAASEAEASPVFFQHLLEMDFAVSKYDKNAVVDEADILEALDYLAPFLSKTSYEDGGIETGQRGGTCVPSSTKTWSRDEFDTLPEYKAFRLYFDYILIQGLYQQLEAQFQEKDERSRTAFIDAAEKLIQAFDKEVHRNQVPEVSWALQATQQLDQWIRDLKKISQDQEIERRKEVQPVRLKTQNGKPQQLIRIQEKDWIQQTQYVDRTGPCYSSFPALLKLDGDHYPSFLKQALAIYQQKLGEARNVSLQAALLSLHHAIDQLPIPLANLNSSPWKNFSNEELVQSCQILRQMATSYLGQSKHEDLPPRRFATLFTIYATVHHLACLIDQSKGRSGAGSLQFYSLPFDANILDEIDNLTFHNRSEFERIKAAKAYFKRFESKPLLFASEASTVVVKESIHKAPQNSQLWEALLRSDETLQKNVDQKSHEKFRDYKPKEIQADLAQQKADEAHWYEEEKQYYELKKQGNTTHLRPKPIFLGELKSLPLITKRSLVLEEFNSEGSPFGNELLAENYSHINAVRFLAHLIREALTSPHPTSPTLKRTGRRGKESFDGSDPNRTYDAVVVSNVLGKKEPTKTDSSQIEWENWINEKQYHRLYRHRDFFELPQTRRKRAAWDRPLAEAKALDQKKLSHPLLYQTLRTLSEWKLTPHQLLLEWSKDFEHLSNQDFQTLFLRLFFRSPIETNRVRLGVGELIHHEELLDNIKAFVLQGLTYFKLHKEKAGNDYGVNHIDGVKFLFEFAFLCQKYMVGDHQNSLLDKLDLIPHLDEWIDEPEKDRAANQGKRASRTPGAILRIYRILHASLKTPLGKLSSAQVHQMLFDWTVMHLYTDSYRPHQISPLIFNFLDEWMSKLLAHHREMLEQNPQEFCQSIYDEVQNQKNVTNKSVLKWAVDPKLPLVFVGVNEATKETYRIDLRRGEFFTPEGRASRVVLSHSWERSEDFKRLFPNHPPFEYTAGGSGAVTFNYHGSMYKILLAQYNQGKDLIQRLEGGWYQYVPPDQIKKEKLGLSQAFSKDHALWAKVKVDEVKQAEAPAKSRPLEAHSTSSRSAIFLIKYRADSGKMENATLEIKTNTTFNEYGRQIAELTSAPYVTVFSVGKACNPENLINLVELLGSTNLFLQCIPPGTPFNSKTMIDLRPYRNPIPAGSQDVPPPPPPENSSPLKAFITSLETGDSIWSIDEATGKIWEMVEKDGYRQILNREVSTHYLDSTDHGLSHFEDPDYILTTLDDQAKTQKTHFSRYRSLDGNPLIFVQSQDGDHLVWKDNQQYLLDKTPQGLFKSHTQYLYLTPLNDKDPAIVLIPFVRYIESQDRKAAVEEWESIPYFEYHLRQDRLIPQSVEARFHLAYLYYQDRKYDHAIQLIRQLDPIETVSSMAFAILQRIYKETPPVDHPNAAMVPLQALFQLIRNRDRQSDEALAAYFDQNELRELNNLIFYAHRVLQGSNHLYETCRLSEKEQRWLFEKLVQEIRSKESLFHQFKMKYPTSLIEHISYWLQGFSRPQVIPSGERKVPENRNVNSLSYPTLRTPYRRLLNSVEAERYQADCRDAARWLESGTPPFLVSRWPLEHRTPRENGGLLLKVLAVAKTGTSFNRLAMLWTLRNWRLHFKQNHEDRPYLDLMIQILLDPTRFPEPIKLLDTPEAQIKALEAINLAVKQPSSFPRVIQDHLKKIKSSSAQTGGSSKRNSHSLPTSWYDHKAKTLKDFGPLPQPPLTKVEDPLDSNRTDTLSQWRKECLRTEKCQDSFPPPPQFKVQEGLLSSQQEGYKDIVQAALDLLTADCAKGVDQLREQEEITSINTGQLLAKIEQEQQAKIKSLKEKEEAAKAMLNQFHLPFQDFFHRLSESLTGVKNTITLEQARLALQKFDQRAFKVLNPTLTEEEIQKIAQLLIEIEDLKSWTLQLGRMQELTEKIQKIANLHDFNQKDLLRKLLVEFESAYHFNTFSPERQVIFRIFAGEMGIIPFKKQVEFIQRALEVYSDKPELLIDCVIQLIMGGGKTAVIAALLMQFLGRLEGKIALFIVPAPLLKVVSQNLSASLKKAFQQFLEVLQVKREDLTLYNLQKYETLLKEAEEYSTAIVMPPSTLPIFELEFVSQSRKLKEHIKEWKNYTQELETCQDSSRQKLIESQLTALSDLIQKRREKVQSLARLINTTPQKGHAVIDEVDTVLDNHLEINFPDGPKIPLSPERNELVYTIFSYIIRDNFKIETLPGKPLVREALNLTMEQQLATFESKEEELKMKQAFEERYRQAADVLALELATSFKPFQTVPALLKRSLCRFLTGKIPYWIQEFSDANQLQFSEKDLHQKDPQWRDYGTIAELKNDCHFIKLFTDRSRSQNPTEKQFAELTSLAVGLFVHILPVTLWQKANRNYGPVPDDPFGKICPYDGVGSPVVDREFGFVWEELCKYYQWACISAPEPAVILELARLATVAAHYYMRKYPTQETFATTAEFSQFQELMGVSLQEFQDPESPGCKLAILKAQETLRKNPANRLLLQKELAAFQVKMHSLHLSANGFSLCRRVLSRTAMSGTPERNVQGYRQSMADNYIPDRGAEGKVLMTLLKKVSKDRIHVRYIGRDFSKVLRAVFEKSLNPQALYGFIDAEGVLSSCPPNYELVRDQLLPILQKLKTEKKLNLFIDTVIFFHQNAPYMWKMGASLPEKLSGTTPEALRAKGLEPRQYFILYDDKRKVGTDFLQVPNAVNIVSVGPKMLQTDLSQASMRLRQLLFSQSAELLINEADLADLYNQGESAEDVTLQAAKNQALRMATDLPHYFKGQIADIFRFYSIERLVDFFVGSKWDQGIFLELMHEGEPYVVQHQTDNLIGQFGRLKKSGETKPALQDQLDRLFESYPFKTAQVKQEVEDLKAHIEKVSLPPKMKISCESIGMETAVEAAVEVDINVEQEQQKSTEVEADIEQELQLYENIERSEYRKDAPISYDQFLQMLTILKSPKPTGMTSLEAQLKKFKYGFKGETKPYHKIFSQPIYGTESYFNTCTYTLPVFHSLQRPPTQILVVKGSYGIRWLLISEHEGNSIKKHLKKLEDKSQIWLIQPNGSLLATTKDPFPLEEEEILKGLLEINVFNGNADWLGYYESYLSPWLRGDSALKIDFLKLRTARHPHQRQILSYLPSILKLAGEHQVDLKSNHMIFSKRAQRELLRAEGVYHPTSHLEVKLLRDLKKIECLEPSSIPLLGIDPKAKDLLTLQALAEAQRLYPNSDKDSIAQLLEVHSQTQIKYLPPSKIEHLVPHQIQWMHIDQIRYLKHSHQICQKQGDSTQYFLTEEHVKVLTPEQANLIPFVDPTFYPLLTDPRHIASVPPEHIDKIQAQYGCYLTLRQIKEGMTSSELIQKFKNSLLCAHWSAISGKWIAQIPPGEVNETHIREIEDQTTLQSLHMLAPDYAKTWIDWLTETQVKKLPDNQLHLLQKTPHIQSISLAKSIEYLTLDQLKHRTLFQKIAYIVTVFALGCFAKFALWTTVAHRFQVQVRYQNYAQKFHQLNCWQLLFGTTA